MLLYVCDVINRVTEQKCPNRVVNIHEQGVAVSGSFFTPKVTESPLGSLGQLVLVLGLGCVYVQ